MCSPLTVPSSECNALPQCQYTIEKVFSHVSTKYWCPDAEHKKERPQNVFMEEFLQQLVWTFQCPTIIITAGDDTDLNTS